MEIEELYAEIIPHLSSRINSFELVLNLKKWKTNYNPLSMTKLFLKVANENDFAALSHSGYKDLIDFITTNIKFIDSCDDVYKSEIRDTEFQIFKQLVSKAQNNIMVSMNIEEMTFEIECADVIADLMFTPLSHFHHEVVLAINQFGEYKKLQEKYPGAKFNPEGKNPTALSNFIEHWVFEALGFKYSYTNGNVVV